LERPLALPHPTRSSRLLKAPPTRVRGPKSFGSYWDSPRWFHRSVAPNGLRGRYPTAALRASPRVERAAQLQIRAESTQDSCLHRTLDSLIGHNIEFSSPAVLKPHILAFPPRPALHEGAFGVCCNDLLDSRTLLTPTKRGGHHSTGSHSACSLSLQSQTLISEFILFKPGRGVDEELAVSWARCWRSDSRRHNPS
jgi:hypothetical protein